MNTTLRLALAVAATASAFAVAPSAHAACPTWNPLCNIKLPNGPDMNGITIDFLNSNRAGPHAGNGRVQIDSTFRNDASPRIEGGVPNASSDASRQVETILLLDGRELIAR